MEKFYSDTIQIFANLDAGCTINDANLTPSDVTLGIIFKYLNIFFIKYFKILAPLITDFRQTAKYQNQNKRSISNRHRIRGIRHQRINAFFGIVVPCCCSTQTVRCQKIITKLGLHGVRKSWLFRVYTWSIYDRQTNFQILGKRMINPWFSCLFFTNMLDAEELAINMQLHCMRRRTYYNSTVITLGGLTRPTPFFHVCSLRQKGIMKKTKLVQGLCLVTSR